MIWAAISWYPAGPINAPNGRNSASNCVDILVNHVHPLVQKVLSDNDTIFQYYNSPIHTARIVQYWFEKYKNALKRLPSPAHLPDLNIIEALWSFFERTLRSRFFFSTISFQATGISSRFFLLIPLLAITKHLIHHFL